MIYVLRKNIHFCEHFFFFFWKNVVKCIVKIRMWSDLLYFRGDFIFRFVYNKNFKKSRINKKCMNSIQHFCRSY